jgi:hypothetical protein
MRGCKSGRIVEVVRGAGLAFRAAGASIEGKESVFNRAANSSGLYDSNAARSDNKHG